jgi:hypothetical protein
MEERFDQTELRQLHIKVDEKTDLFFSSYWGNVGQLARIAKRPYGKADADLLGFDYDMIQTSRSAAGSVNKSSLFLPKTFYNKMVEALCTKSPYLKGMEFLCDHNFKTYNNCHKQNLCIHDCDCIHRCS